MTKNEKTCSACGPDVSRRDFMKTAAGAAVAASLVRSKVAWADLKDDAPENLVKAFHKSLTDEQRKEIVLPWDHKYRLHVSNNWNVVRPKIGQFYTKDQQQLIRDIVKGLSSPEGQEKFPKVMKQDKGSRTTPPPSSQPRGRTSSVWSSPAPLTRWRQPGGRRLGADLYGNAGTRRTTSTRADPSGELLLHQAQLASKLFGALDGKQRERRS
jgi:hypothetical protein